MCVCDRSSPAPDSPNTPSPLPDPALQLAVEAKELVTGVCMVTSDDKGTNSPLELSKIIFDTSSDTDNVSSSLQDIDDSHSQYLSVENLN